MIGATPRSYAGRAVADPILDDLNQQQREAVLHGHGPLLVVAGAGSGKTRVIARRVARLLRDGIEPRRIVALTFTNKAAGEMGGRIEALGGHKVHVSTFHSACARWLRIDGHLLGYPRDYSIYDTQDRDVLLKALIEELGADRYEVKPSAVGRRISQLKGQRVRPGELPLGLSAVDRVVEVVYGPYDERLRRLGALDFDDLQNRFLDLLDEHPLVAERYQQRCEWLLVDEFQDTNRVQYEIARRLSARHRNLCVVGDPDQSIYRFRGAEIRNILEFEQDFPDATVVRLETNYRSTKTILRAAEAVIEHNKSRKQKRLRTDNEPGERLQVVVAGDDDREAVEIAEAIRGLLAAEVSPAQVAIFYRAHYQSRALETALRQRGIAYDIVGGLSFFERREIKDLLAYLRAATNPLDEVAFERIVNVPPRGIGKGTLQKLREAARELRMSILEVAADPTLQPGVSGKARKGLAELTQLRGDLRAAGERSAQAALQLLLARTRYVDHICALGDPEDVTREENIDELLHDALIYDRLGGSGLAGWLQHVSLLTTEDRRGEQGPRVVMMTIHAAKGLEFDHVLVAGLDENLFPHARSVQTEADLEEERRLMYVALTRARLTLRLYRAEFRYFAGETIGAQPSRFLSELPLDCIAEPEPAWQSTSLMPDDAVAAVVQPGAHVVHAVYGPGVVQHVSGSGIQAQAQVRFADGSERNLLLEYSKLRVVPVEGDESDEDGDDVAW
jgi:DNA helicase-2/ATP-dependent DNA helicase PcrA